MLLSHMLVASTGEPFGPVLLFFADHSSAHRLALDLAVETAFRAVRLHMVLQEVL